MTQDEIVKLAVKIAKAEKIIRNSSSSLDKVKKAKLTILKESKKITSLDEMVLIDELVQELLKL